MKNFETILKVAMSAANEGCIAITKNNYVSVTGFSFQAREFMNACKEAGYPLKEMPGTPYIHQYMDDTCIIQVHLI